MKLPGFSNLGEKCKKISDDLNLDEKLMRSSNAVEKKYTEISNAIDLDEKISKASDALSGLGETCVKVSNTLGLDEKMMKLSSTLDHFGEKHTNISETLRTGEYRPELFADQNALNPVSRTESDAEIYNNNKNIDEITPLKNNIPENVIDVQCKVNNSKVRKNCITCKRYFVKGKNPATNRFKTIQVVVESTASMEAIQQKSGFLPPFEITEISLGAPTEKQIAYAKKLRLSLPQDAAFEDVSIFLTRYEERRTLYPSPMPEKLIRYLIGKGIYVPAYASEDEAHNLYFRNIDLDEKIAYFAMKVYCNLKRKVYYTLEDAEPEMKDLFYSFAMKYKDNKEFVRSLSYYSGSDLPLGSYTISKKLKAYDTAVDFFIK